MQKTTLLDFPGRVSALIFTQGCNFHCPYCHNPQLARGEGADIPLPDVLAFLARRVSVLQGVVISGGEPTLQPRLADVCARVRQLGYAVKLDTNGSRPDVLEALLAEKLLDYVALDVKAPPAAYPAALCGRRPSGGRARGESGGLSDALLGALLGTLLGVSPDGPPEGQPDGGADGQVDGGTAGRAEALATALPRSIQLLREAGIPHEYRVTCVAPFVTEENFPRLLDALHKDVPCHVQRARLDGPVLRPDFFPASGRALSLAEVEALARMAVARGYACAVRGA